MHWDLENQDIPIEPLKTQGNVLVSIRQNLSEYVSLERAAHTIKHVFSILTDHFGQKGFPS